MSTNPPAPDEHDQTLMDRVHPADWVNPEPRSRYHLVVIGAGTGGLVSAAAAAALGAKVALIERERMGGDCLNYGCVPSKALLRCARAAADVRRAHEFGVKVSGDVHVDFPAVMARLRKLRADISVNDSVQRFRGLGVDVFFGNASFTGPDRVTTGSWTLQFRRAIIATGTRPDVPAIPGLADAGYLTNETVFSLTTLPARLAIIGGGAIGCELAQAFARFGANVTLIEATQRILQREAADAVRIVHAALERDGVSILSGTHVLGVAIQDSRRTLTLQSHQGETRTLVVDAILVAAGRLPNLEGLGLNAAGIEWTDNVLMVNDRLQTANPRIFAVGDVCSKERYTHLADAHARLAVRNALFYGRAKQSALAVPRCLYTDPEVAGIGLDETAAHEAGVPIDAFVQEFTHVDRAILDGETDGFVRILVRKGADRIVGATIVSRRAGDMIGEVALAMTGNLGLKTFANTIHPYPTHGEALRKIGDAYNRRRLTPTVKWLFEKWFQWT